ncbi:MAG: putative signaling protein [Alphaproteobacteria bacterium MarineAlpha2_Bin1]|nr:MAG: putative signaling protein [Alphaproteobacteria bacterium MarineAlpha2_Bin1]
MSNLNENYISILDSLEVSVVLLRESGSILYANSFFEKISGHLKEDLINLDQSVIFKEIILEDHENHSLSAKLIAKEKKFIDVTISTRNYLLNSEKIKILTIFHKFNNKILNNDKNKVLTGILERDSIIKKLNIFMESAKLSGDRLVALAVKLDKIKSINQYAGYDVGDALIFEVSKILKSILPIKSIFGRITGDKFFVIYKVTKDTESAAIICKRIVNSLSKFITVDKNQYNISSNVGAALYPQDVSDAEMLMDATDKALEESEIRGHNRFQFYNKDINRKIIRLNFLDQAIPKAIKENQFYLKFQPTVKLDNKLINGAEALLRWETPEIGNVSPSEFVPRAEFIGSIVPLGEWVLEKACSDAKTWSSLVSSPLRIGVNFSPIQLAEENIVDSVIATLEKNNFSPQLLDIELTEYSFLKDQNSAIRSILSLKEKGISFSLDDFGTGYSSLSQLASYPVDKIKIDQSLIAGITKNDESIAIVKAIVTMAKEIGILVLAEGVESKYEAEFLSSIGCDYAQGHYFYKPLSQADFLKILNNENFKLSKV